MSENIELRWYVREVAVGVSVMKKVKTLQWRRVAGYSTEPTGKIEDEASPYYGEPTYTPIWSEWVDVPTVEEVDTGNMAQGLVLH